MKTIEQKLIQNQDKRKDSPLFVAVVKAQLANKDFVEWLESQAPKKNGPSGIGKDNYTWYQQNVHRIP